MSDELKNWPPQYKIKKNSRARHVKLKASLHDGLEIVVPVRFNQKSIPEILEQNKLWIVKKLSEINELLKNTDRDALPSEISLAAINQAWKVEYIKANHKKVVLFARPQHELVLMGDVENKMLCKKILMIWVKRQAKNHLGVLLKNISEQIQLPYKDFSVRAQRSRWGSCSEAKSISLNYKLIFLPYFLTAHILIHELCHTVHLNHSAKFWRLVASFDSKWKENNRAMRKADKLIPVWVG